MTLLAAEEVQRFGVKPSVALLSHSSFGSSDAPSAVRRCATRSRSSSSGRRSLAVEGEMRADSALSKAIRDQEFPEFAADRGRQSADHAEHRCREHHVQRVAGYRRGRHHGRRHTARRGQSRCTS